MNNAAPDLLLLPIYADLNGLLLSNTKRCRYIYGDENDRCDVSEDCVDEGATGHKAPDLRLGQSYFLRLMNEAEGSFVAFTQLLESELVELFDKRRYCETTRERMYDAGIALRTLNLGIMERVLMNLTKIGERTKETIGIATKKALSLYDDDLAELWNFHRTDTPEESVLTDAIRSSGLSFLLSGAVELNGISTLPCEPPTAAERTDVADAAASSQTHLRPPNAFARDLESEISRETWRELFINFEDRRGRRVRLHMLDGDEEATFSKRHKQT